MNLPEAPRTCVILVEDEPALRARLARSIADAGYSVMAHASIDELDDSALPDVPCVAVLDMRLSGGGTGLDALAMLRERRPGLPVVFMSGNSTPEEIIRSMKLGTLEFLLKPFRLQELLDAIARGSAAERARFETTRSRTRVETMLARLSPRERQVFELMINGKKTAEIAAELGMAAGTAKIHRLRVLEKFWCDSVAQLIEMLRGSGMFEVRLPDTPKRPAARK